MAQDPDHRYSGNNGSGKKRMSASEREKLRRKKKRLQVMKLVMLGILVLLLIAAAVYGVMTFVSHRGQDKKETIPVVTTTAPEEMTEAPTTTTAEAENGHPEVCDEASRLMAMYDYDGAVEYVKTQVPD